MRTFIDIAELVNTKNLKGGLVARSASGLPLLMFEGMELALVPPVLDAPRNVVVESLQFKSDDEAVVFFEEVAEPDVAKMLVGCHCLAYREDIAEELTEIEKAQNDMPNWSGWIVFDQTAGYVGTVDYVEDRPMQPLLVVIGEQGQEILIPLVEEFIVGVNEDQQRLDLQCPVGLLEL